MSCVVAVVRDGTITMGADRLIASGSTAFVNLSPKIARYGDLLIGNTGDMRTHPLLYGKHWDVPFAYRELPDSLVAWLQRDVVGWMREQWKQAGVLVKKTDGTESLEANLLIGCKGRLFELNEFSISEAFGYHAVGAGRDIALGAFYAMDFKRLTPARMVRRALEAVEHHCLYVRSPFDLVEMQ